MRTVHLALSGMMLAGMVGGLAACAGDSTAPSAPSAATTPSLVSAAPFAASIRLRCDRFSNRSKISVDGRNLSPRAGSFRARVSAAGGTKTSAAQNAVGGEAEFDFDSNRADIQAGATRIAASFIRARAGSDVVAQILNGQGQVVATQGADCRAR